jgi:hypothetical protein
VKVETALFGGGIFFFFPLALVYGLLAEWEPVGTAGLLLTGGLSALVGGYLWMTSRRIDARPEDDPMAGIEEGAGEQGFFSPHSWWPLPLGIASALVFLGLAVGWWVSFLGVAVGAVALIGWVYEYYRGAHAH